MNQPSCKNHNIGVDFGTYVCLDCRCHFSMNALKKCLEKRFGKNWQAEWKKLHSEKMTIRQKVSDNQSKALKP